MFKCEIVNVLLSDFENFTKIRQQIMILGTFEHGDGGEGGVTCHDFGYACAAGVPGPHPIHILG